MITERMPDNIKKRDSLKIAVIINIVIVILIFFLFDVESLGEYRLILLPLFGIFSITLITLSICFLVKSIVKIIRGEKLKTGENVATGEEPKKGENFTTRKKDTLLDTWLIVIILFINLPLIDSFFFGGNLGNYDVPWMYGVFPTVFVILSVCSFVRIVDKIIKGENVTLREIILIIIIIFLLLK